MCLTVAAFQLEGQQLMLFEDSRRFCVMYIYTGLLGQDKNCSWVKYIHKRGSIGSINNFFNFF